LYEHCILSIKRALRYGEHGLPLIGTGDWNDGMNLIGKDGKGESVWLGFFLSYILKSMSKISKELNDNEFYNLCIDELKKLELSIEKVWDGDWYQRAFFDNGEVLGSSTNKECKIDSLPQSWAVISDTGSIERKKKAMESVDKLLVDRENSLIKLFNPPFDHMSNNPGYIKGYVPGVRENGGQYTHAAVWSIIAFALLKDKEKTYELIKLINPINHSLDEKASNKYKVEPYVMAADIYTADSHMGRGGWTWYTGSASWMYQLLIKYVIGLKLAQDKLYLDPCMPKEWKDLSVSYQHKETFFDIKIKNIGKTENILITVDGIKQKENYIKLNNDKKKHKVDIVLG
jgi:cellobiose phosphorylase